ncbi:MAG: hypothetical protein Ct9H90mP10_10810 [Actinomycetota bacterium]|nr:MAG: hypothetical protein Ct9H90mP10_10810 [Actinomycetota bacterium]
MRDNLKIIGQPISFKFLIQMATFFHENMDTFQTTYKFTKI